MSYYFLISVALSSILCCVLSLNLTNHIDIAKDSNQKIRMIYKILAVMNRSLSSHEQTMNTMNESIEALREDMYKRIGENNEIMAKKIEKQNNETMNTMLEAVKKSFTSHYDKKIDEMNEAIHELKKETDRLKIMKCNNTSTKSPPFVDKSDKSPVGPLWKSFRDQNFTLIKEEKTWNAARDYCRSIGAHLPEIHDAPTNEFINVMQTKYGTWLGINDVKSEGAYVWDHSKRPVSYTNWTVGRPSGDVWDCGHMMGDGTWILLYTTDIAHFICQKKAVNGKKQS